MPLNVTKSTIISVTSECFLGEQEFPVTSVLAVIQWKTKMSVTNKLYVVIFFTSTIKWQRNNITTYRNL